MIDDYLVEENCIEVNDDQEIYKSLISHPMQNETYKIIGACMEVHNEFGRGFLEAVYKDALEIIFNESGIPFEREKRYNLFFRGEKLKSYYIADFIVFDEIVLEVKANSELIDSHYDQVINYLAVSKCKIGLIVNFGEKSLKYKRVVLSK